jgi:site-specific recombinase XerD
MTLSWAFGGDMRARREFITLSWCDRDMAAWRTCAATSDDDKIRVAQQKTGAKLAISVHPNLRRSLDACPSGHVAAIATAYGRAFSVKGFGQFVADTIRKAALPTHCKAHGLRKAAARRLAEAGCSLHEIAAVTGHKTLSEIERYTRAASQEALNASAIEKQAANKQVATLPLRIGNPADKH